MHREQVHRRALARPVGRGREAPAAQGRALRAACAGRRRAGPVALRNDLVLPASRTPTVASTPSSSARAPRRALAARSAEAGGRGARRCTPGRCCPTTSTSRGRRTWPRDARPCCTATCSGSPVAGRSSLPRNPPTRQAHLALIRAAPTQGDVRGGAAPVRADGPGAAARARHRARARRPQRAARRLLARALGAAGTRVRRRASGAGWSAGATSATSCAVGSTDAGRRGQRQHPAAWPAPPGSGSRRCSTWPTRSRPRRGWRAGRGGPPRRSRAPGPTPRCSRRFADLCRQHPALLDGLDDEYRRRDRAALSRAGTSAGPASPATSDCSSRPPS